MKRLMLCLVLALGLVMISSTSSWAGIVLFDGTLHWRNGGTIVTDDTDPTNTKSWSVGNPTGQDIIQVDQKDFILEEGDTDNPSLLGLTKFTWDVINDRWQYSIYSFHVKGQGFRPFDIGAATGWTWSYDSAYEEYIFSTTTNPIGTTDSAKFYLITNAPEVGYGTARVDTRIDNNPVWFDEGGLWIVTHPTPEPASMAMVGLGLLGLGGRMRRKRFKA